MKIQLIKGTTAGKKPLQTISRNESDDGKLFDEGDVILFIAPRYRILDKLCLAGVAIVGTVDSKTHTHAPTLKWLASISINDMEPLSRELLNLSNAPNVDGVWTDEILAEYSTSLNKLQQQQIHTTGERRFVRAASHYSFLLINPADHLSFINNIARCALSEKIQICYGEHNETYYFPALKVGTQDENGSERACTLFHNDETNAAFSFMTCLQKNIPNTLEYSLHFSYDGKWPKLSIQKAAAS